MVNITIKTTSNNQWELMLHPSSNIIFNSKHPNLSLRLLILQLHHQHYLHYHSHFRRLWILSCHHSNHNHYQHPFLHQRCQAQRIILTFQTKMDMIQLLSLLNRCSTILSLMFHSIRNNNHRPKQKHLVLALQHSYLLRENNSNNNLHQMLKLKPMKTLCQ